VGDFFIPEKILDLVSKKDTRKDIINTVKLSARLCSAFFELIDPKAKRRIIEQLMDYGSDYLFIVPEFNRHLLVQAVTNDRFFDEGHNPSVELIKKCFDQIGNALDAVSESGEMQAIGSISVLDSKDSIMIQACDFAAGIARRIYQEEGLAGLKARFEVVVFNGCIQ
jgi:hypothetical protein